MPISRIVKTPLKRTAGGWPCCAPAGLPATTSNDLTDTAEFRAAADEQEACSGCPWFQVTCGGRYRARAISRCGLGCGLGHGDNAEYFPHGPHEATFTPRQERTCNDARY